MARSHVIELGLSTIHMQCRVPWCTHYVAPLSNMLLRYHICFQWKSAIYYQLQELNYNAIWMKNYLEIRKTTMKTYR